MTVNYQISMKWLSAAIFVISLQTILVHGGSSQDGSAPDIFEVIIDKLIGVTAENCHSKHRWELELDSEYISQVPVYNKLFSHVTYANRSKLVHLHNTAMSRGLYFSFLYGVLNQSKDFQDEPDLVYLYMKSSADVSANRGWIDGSALMFDKQCFYPNWMPMVDFNRTLSLFGVHSFKDSNYDTKWVREPINSTNGELMSGTVFKDNFERDYTDGRYKYCPYTRYDEGYGMYWWPDTSGYKDSLRKKTYSVGVKFSDVTGRFKTDDFETISFFGVSTPGDFDQDITLPVIMTKPYFDCRRSNKWIVSMTSPVAEYMTRYNPWTHMRRPRFTAVAAMDMEFEKIDLNPCHISEGNPLPNMFGGTAHCRLDTTVCEPLSGFGFRRGGYQCVCRAGLYYPWGQDGPFQGVDIETASEEELNNGTFDCVTADELANYNGNESVTPGQKKVFEVFNEEKWSEAQVVMEKARSVPQPCNKPASLSSGIISGVSEQFEAQGRTALGISHFLSNFLQNSWALHDILYMNSEYPKPPFKHYLKKIHVFAEVLAALMGDMKLSGVGVYFDRNKFAAADGVSQYFGPYAYKIPPLQNEEADYRAIDLAGIGSYAYEEWFTEMKQKWANNVDNLEHFNDSSAIFTDAEISYRAPTYTDGKWSGPTYKCDGMLSDWVFTYRVPFFGPVSSGRQLYFIGLVAADVKLEYLDINQCPAENSNYTVFSNTAKCHYETQYCIPVPGKRFNFGGYNCIFRQGYELPGNFTVHHNLTTDQGGSIPGETMEVEYEKKERNETHRHDDLKGQEIQIVTTTTTIRPVGGAEGLVLGGTTFRAGVCVLTMLLLMVT